MSDPTTKLSRCAVYTRKSTEHNLDLAFTSLDAQREACEAYTRSQPSASGSLRCRTCASFREPARRACRGISDESKALLSAMKVTEAKEYLIDWIEMDYAPEHYSTAQFDELDRLTAQWIADHLRRAKTTKTQRRTRHS